MKRGPERRASRRDLAPMRFWALFHDVWGKAVGTPDYVKAQWQDLQRMAEQVLGERRRKQT